MASTEANTACVYVVRFGEHSEWNSLHDSAEWQPLTTIEVEASEPVQHCHFSTFFVAAHGTRHALSPRRNLCLTLRGVRNCLEQWKVSRPWLQLRRGLRIRMLLRRRVRALAVAMKQRLNTLESWLTFWNDTEAKAQEDLRSRSRSPRAFAPMTAGQAEQMAVAQVMTSTSQKVKCQVLWELYWLLYAQTRIQKDLQWARWRTLLQRRQNLRAQRAPARHPQSKVVDFTQDEPVSLRAVNAALFVMALQPPCFNYQAGHEVTFKELLRLANSPQPVFRSSAVDSWMRHAPGIITAFMDSHLCREAAWLRKRFTVSTSLIPPQTWRAEERTPPKATVLEVRTDTPEDGHLLLLEEHTFLTPQRRLGNSPIHSSHSPRLLGRRQTSTLPRQSSCSPEQCSSVERMRPTGISPSPSTPLAASTFLNRPLMSQQRSVPDLLSPRILKQGPIFVRATTTSLEDLTLSPSALSPPRHGTLRFVPVQKEPGFRRQASDFIGSPTPRAAAAPKIFSLPPLRHQA
eukprot:GGOE01025420.1.p1 GENE.GGOE01025420.1~~GGOE01025420.1.p1  ORF type:complete len:516 (-),score=91.68 GGOE01025420.1:1125-2672(-)